MSGAAGAAAALAAVGARFRLHGRDPASGLDCVGVAALAVRAGGFRGSVPSGYAIRGGDPAALAARFDTVLAAADGARPGDIVLMRSGPAQLHLGVIVAGGMVHADAGLRRVVLRPGPPAWPVIGAWRLGED
ncbi:peptidoglycan endopeptidase [uncultured Sphingomonas sp.]|uniref:peptidoglycan endopeptidase n=1 Tax=uncultured Sphingomonas sp. TaxID=158754 RepID=UPI0035C97CB4